MSTYTNGLAFWKHFESLENMIISLLNEEKYEQLNEIISELDDECMEISGAHFFVDHFDDYYEMTFDTGPNKTTQYICQMLKEIASEKIRSRWMINASLEPMSQKAIQALLQIKDQTYSLADFHVFYTIENNMFDCLIYCPGYNMIDNPERKKEMSMYLLELAIGQKMYEAYIGSVDFIDLPDDERKICNMIDFYDVIEQTVIKLKWQTYKNIIDIYSVFQPIQDFAHDALRKDMKIIFSTHPLLVEETIEEKKDVIHDLTSKDGEFGYIYFNNMYHDTQDALFRQELSNQINETMNKLHCAKVIGGAIGKSYAYIDMIIFDRSLFDEAFKQIQKKLKTKLELYYRSF